MADSPHQSSPIRVLLVDDQTLIRQGLRSALEAYPNIEVVGEARDGEEAIMITATMQPAVIVMDFKMPKMDGIEATRLIKANSPEIVVVGFSTLLEEHQVSAMQKAGAYEVLNKDVSVTELYGAIQRGVAAIKPVLILEQSSREEKRPKEPQHLQPDPPQPMPKEEEKT